MQNAWAIIEPILISLKDFILNTVIPTVEQLYVKWTTVWWPTIQTVLQNTWTALEAIFKELGRWVNDNIVPWVEFLYTQWTTVWWPAISAAVDTAWGIIEPLLTAAGDWLEVTIPAALTALQTAWDSVWGGLSPAIDPVREAIDGIKGAVEAFWTFITSHTFDFQINIPDLPDWAIPGSPLPIHTAWKQFAQDMSRMSIAPRMDLSGMEAALAVGGRGDQTVTQDNSSKRVTLIGARFEGVNNAQQLLEDLEAMAR